MCQCCPAAVCSSGSADANRGHAPCLPDRRRRFRRNDRRGVQQRSEAAFGYGLRPGGGTSGCVRSTEARKRKRQIYEHRRCARKCHSYSPQCWWCRFFKASWGSLSHGPSNSPGPWAATLRGSAWLQLPNNCAQRTEHPLTDYFGPFSLQQVAVLHRKLAEVDASFGPPRVLSADALRPRVQGCLATRPSCVHLTESMDHHHALAWPLGQAAFT